MIDLRTSRRDYFLYCTYWSQIENEDLVANNEIIHTKIPTGSFYAKEVNSYTIESDVVASVFMAESTTITIETADDVSDLRRNDIVKIDDKVYRVDNIQKTPIKKQRQFLRNSYSMNYVISLRG